MLRLIKNFSYLFICLPIFFYCESVLDTKPVGMKVGDQDIQDRISSCVATGEDPQLILTSSKADEGFDRAKIIPDEFKDKFLPNGVDAQCEGENNFPKLRWSNVHPDTKSFVLIMEDITDATTWIHLNLFNINKSTCSIEKLTATEMDHTLGFMDPKQEVIDFSSVGGQLGENTWKDHATGPAPHLKNPNQDGWAGPCPPPTKTRKYCFRLYSLNVESLSLALNRTRSADFKTNNGSKILQEAEICGMVANP